MKTLLQLRGEMLREEVVALAKRLIEKKM